MSLLLVPVTRLLAFRFGILDKPGGRKTHHDAMPCLGGLAIFAVFMTVVLVSLSGFYFLHKMALAKVILPQVFEQRGLLRHVAPKLFTVLGGAAAILLIGLIDDIIGARFDYRLKFLAQSLVALGMVAGGIRLDFLPFAWLNSVVTVVWIVGITNAFNLLDNMDGISAGVAYICSMLFFFIAAEQGQYFIGLIFLTLAGSLLGFLYFNFHPARTFLGNTGALFIGFLLATISVVMSYATPASQTFFTILMPVIVLSLPIFDTARVTAIRWHEKRPLFEGDRRHISHRLVELGMTQSQAAVTVYLMTFALGVGATALDLQDRFANTVILIQVMTMIAIISLLMAFGRR